MLPYSLGVRVPVKGLNIELSWVWGYFLTIMENQVESKIENEVELGVRRGYQDLDWEMRGFCCSLMNTIVRILVVIQQLWSCTCRGLELSRASLPHENCAPKPAFAS